MKHMSRKKPCTVEGTHPPMSRREVQVPRSALDSQSAHSNVASTRLLSTAVMMMASAAAALAAAVITQGVSALCTCFLALATHTYLSAHRAFPLSSPQQPKSNQSLVEREVYGLTKSQTASHTWSMCVRPVLPGACLHASRCTFLPRTVSTRVTQELFNLLFSTILTHFSSCGV